MHKAAFENRTPRSDLVDMFKVMDKIRNSKYSQISQKLFLHTKKSKMKTLFPQKVQDAKISIEISEVFANLGFQGMCIQCD